MTETRLDASRHDPFASMPTPEPSNMPTPEPSEAPKKTKRREPKQVVRFQEGPQSESLPTPVQTPTRSPSKKTRAKTDVQASPEHKPSPVIKSQALRKIFGLIVLLGSLTAIGIGIAGLGSKLNFWQAGALAQLPPPALIGCLGGGILSIVGYEFSIVGFDFIAYACSKKGS